MAVACLIAGAIAGFIMIIRRSFGVDDSHKKWLGVKIAMVGFLIGSGSVLVTLWINASLGAFLFYSGWIVIVVGGGIHVAAMLGHLPDGSKSDA